MAKNTTGGIPKDVADSPEYAFAKTCRFCHDTCDSFGRYVSTYCYKHHEHLTGFAGAAGFACTLCGDYEKRDGKD